LERKIYFALFQYHDEPLAPSYKLPNKVPENIIKQRFEILSNIVNDLIDKKSKQKYSWKQIIWTIMNILDNEVVVRPFLHAPEIDPYHNVNFDKIL